MRKFCYNLEKMKMYKNFDLHFNDSIAFMRISSQFYFFKMIDVDVQKISLKAYLYVPQE